MGQKGCTAVSSTREQPFKKGKGISVLTPKIIFFICAICVKWKNKHFGVIYIKKVKFKSKRASEGLFMEDINQLGDQIFHTPGAKP